MVSQVGKNLNCDIYRFATDFYQRRIKADFDIELDSLGKNSAKRRYSEKSKMKYKKSHKIRMFAFRIEFESCMRMSHGNSHFGRY